MGIARYLSKLASGLSSEGVIPASKGGTGTTTGGSGGPKISSIIVTNSSYTNLDDTAVDVAGGYIKLIGSGFASGCQVLVGTVAATSVTFVSDSEVRAQVPATAAGTYIVYLVNSDGGVAIRVNGITFSTTPTWVSTSPFGGTVNQAISIQLSATGASTFSLASGSTLPSGVSLSSGGLLTGTVTGISSETTYNFTILATDAELQDSPRTFALTITVGDPFFKNVSLLLAGNGTNNANNNTIVDSSANNYTINRFGNTAQGTFSPFGENWSNYFDGTGDMLAVAPNAALDLTGDFTIELWVNLTGTGSGGFIINKGGGSNIAWASYELLVSGADIWFAASSANNGYDIGGENATGKIGSYIPGQWTHLAITRSGNVYRGFVNGVQGYTQTLALTPYTASTRGLNIGASYQTSWGVTANIYQAVTGSISNFRIVKGTAVYTTNFTLPISSLTAVTNTVLLTCQSNRFNDNSTNNFAITKYGDVNVQRFNPFSPSNAYSTSTIGGSIYFDGSGDHLNPTCPAYSLGTEWTIEFWYYATVFGGILFDSRPDNTNGLYLNMSIQTAGINLYYNAADRQISHPVTLNSWNHVAAVKRSGAIYIYHNGVQVDSFSDSNTYQVGTDRPRLSGNGGFYSAAPGNLQGYVSNLRIVPGTAVYTANFTPSTTPLTAIAGTKLLLSGTNSGVIDSSMSSNMETIGDAKISTAQSKFGGSSLYFDGTGDSLKGQPNINTFGTGNFTIEMWLYPQSAVGYQCVLFMYTAVPYIYIGINTGSTATPFMWNDANVIVGSQNFTLNTWQHWAIVRNNGIVTMYLNGTSIGSATFSGSLGDGLGTQVGTTNTGIQGFNGYIDDLRITKGVARYTANFTPPTTAHQLK
jgi:hypothetical protein